MTFITHGFRVSVVSDVRERAQDFRITFALYAKKIFISWVWITRIKERQLDWMRLDSALKKSRPQYISAQKILTLFDALDEREIVR
jgi:hypothetical protein